MSQKKKTTAQSKRPRKAPSNQTGGTAWGKKAAAAISGKMQSADVKKLILLNFPYIIAFYMVEKAAWLYRHCNGDTIVDRLMVLFMNFGLAYKSYLPSFHPFDLMVGLIGAAALKAVIYFKGKNAKKYRQGEEYGSARWGNAKDIEPFIDPVFENNVLLTQTVDDERQTKASEVCQKQECHCDRRLWQRQDTVFRKAQSDADARKGQLCLY